MTMGEPDNRIEVLKEIRDEIRGVRSELAELRGGRLATSGVRTEVVDRAARWRIAAMASTGALAVVVLAFALRAGPNDAPVAMAPASAPTTPVPSLAPLAPAPAPVVASAPKPTPPAPVAQPAVAAKPAARPAPRLLASAPPLPAPKKRVKPEAAPEAAPAAVADDGDTIPFPPPRRSRVHRMSYGPVESEPAKL
jgi:hypothetical protein